MADTYDAYDMLKEAGDTYIVICERLLQQYISKNTAYGNNMSKNFRKYGNAVYAMRISDKLGRLDALTSDPTIYSGDESIIDTIGDTITYCLMCAGDIAAREIVNDFIDRTINMKFTEELFVDIIANPSIIGVTCDSNDAYYGMRKYTSDGTPIFDPKEASNILDVVYTSGDMARGCYYLAMRLLQFYALLELIGEVNCNE